MRGHENEHADSLPKLEITSLKHVAYLLDAFVYYLRSKSNIKITLKTLDEPSTTVDNATTSNDSQGYKSSKDDDRLVTLFGIYLSAVKVGLFNSGTSRLLKIGIGEGLCSFRRSIW